MYAGVLWSRTVFLNYKMRSLYSPSLPLLNFFVQLFFCNYKNILSSSLFLFAGIDAIICKLQAIEWSPKNTMITKNCFTMFAPYVHIAHATLFHSFSPPPSIHVESYPISSPLQLCQHHSYSWPPTASGGKKSVQTFRQKELADNGLEYSISKVGDITALRWQTRLKHLHSESNI